MTGGSSSRLGLVVVFLLIGAGCGRATVSSAGSPGPSGPPTLTASPSPSPNGLLTSPAARRVVIPNCKLPVSGSTQGSGGFIQLPGGTFTADPASNVPFPGAADPAGLRLGYTYDAHASKWLPAPKDWVRSDLSSYVYPGVSPAPHNTIAIHRVDVGTGVDTVWMNGETLYGHIVTLRPEGVYGAGGPEILTLVDSTGLVKTADQSRYGLFAVITGTSYFETQWSHGSVYQLTDVMRVDAKTGGAQVWFHRPGFTALPIGLDAHDNPIVAVGSQDKTGHIVASEIWIVPQASTGAQPHGTLIYYAPDQPLTIQGPPVLSAGVLWFETDGGLWASDGIGSSKAADHSGYISGGCL